jgi:hypothetical protein
MLFHLSYDFSQVIPIFTPRIPDREQRMEGENGNIPRICVAKSIEDCLSAMPGGGYALETCKKTHRIRVYEFDERKVDPANLIPPAHLYFSGWVLDAWVTGEYWVVNQNLVPDRCYDIELDSFSVIDAPFVHPLEFREASLKYKNPEDLLDELENLATQYIARVAELRFRKVRENKIIR